MLEKIGRKLDIFISWLVYLAKKRNVDEHENVGAVGDIGPAYKSTT